MTIRPHEATDGPFCRLCRDLEPATHAILLPLDRGAIAIGATCLAALRTELDVIERPQRKARNSWSVPA